MKTLGLVKRLGMVSCALGLLIMPAPARAGADLTGYARCSKKSDGSGECEGTFAGFFNSDFSAYAQFWGPLRDGASPNQDGVQFYAVLKSVPYTCYFFPDLRDAQWYTALLSSRSFFHLYWDQTGTCYQVTITNTSASGL
jgi:hypothetical protein